jgi:hypothetical protein
MKKYFLFSLVLFAVLSCQEDVRFNNPSFQGVKDNVFWRAIVSSASTGANGVLVIEAYRGNEIITLKTTSAAEGTYFLGTSDSKTATYVIEDATSIQTYSTGLGKGDGRIVITEYDSVNQTVSGTFNFNAENSDNNSSLAAIVNFRQGVFYKLPIDAQP